MKNSYEEIAQIVTRQQQAWNNADAASYSRDRAEDLSFTNIVGKLFLGRAAFEERHVFLLSDIFNGSRLDMSMERIHLPRPEIAIVDISCILSGYQALPPGVSPQDDGKLHTCLLEVLVQTENGWRVAAYHNVDKKR